MENNIANNNEFIGLVPLSKAERAPMQKLFVSGHLLPGIDLSTGNLRNLIDGLGGVTKMNIFHGPNIKTPEDFDSETYRRLGCRPPEDINVTWMWDDSGGSIYVFPRRQNWCLVDLHTCKTFDAQATLRLLYKQLHFREDMQFAEQTHDLSTSWQPFISGRRSLTPENEHFGALCKILNVDLNNSEELIREGESLERTVFLAIKEGWGSRLAALFTPELAEKMRVIHSAYEILVDRMFMQGAIEGRYKSHKEYPFKEIYFRLAAMEEKIAQKKSSVIHIGPGYPGTAIELFNQFGIHVTGVEIDPNVVELSQKTLNNFGLLGKDKIEVICANGCDINPEDFWTVIISAMVATDDKLNIIQNMIDLATEDDGPLLILRRPYDSARALIYQDLPDMILNHPKLQLVGKTEPGKDDPLQSLVYRVLPRSAVRRGLDDYIIRARERLHTV